ncbi:MAG: ABC transporter permease [Clostridium sp.]
MALQKSEGIPKNTLEVSLAFGKSIDFNEFIDTFKDISEDTNITFEKVAVKIDGKENEVPVNFEYFKNKPSWRYPILEGRDYSGQEVIDGEKVVLIGKKLQQYIYEDNGVEKIKIEDEEYVVTGIVGRENKDSPWDEEIFMSIKAVPNMKKIRFNGEKMISILLKNNNNEPMEDCNMLEKKIKNTEGLFQVKELDTRNDILVSNFSDNAKLRKMTLRIYIFAIINMMNISIYWIEERRREIGIRKAFGIDNVHIAYMLFFEIFSLCLISSVIGLGVQFIINCILGKISNYVLELTLCNIISGLATSFITALFTVLIPIIYSLKVEPIEIIKK